MEKCLTVKDLIEELSKYSPNLLVATEDGVLEKSDIGVAKAYYKINPGDIKYQTINVLKLDGMKERC